MSRGRVTAPGTGWAGLGTLLSMRRRDFFAHTRASEGASVPASPGQHDTIQAGAPAPKTRNRLFIKYVALFVAVVCMALLANGIFEVFFYYQEHKAALIRIQREQAEAAAAKLGQFIREIERQLGWTTQLPWSAGLIEQRQLDAQRLLRQVPAITELAQLDATGKERLRVSRLASDVVGSGTDFSTEPQFTEAVAHKVYYGPVYFRRESEPYMTLSLAGTRRDSGVSVAEVNLKLIWDVVSQIKVGERGHAYVVGAQGRLIAHPDINLVLRNTNMSQLAQVQAAGGDAVGTASAPVQVAQNIQGHQVLTAYAQVMPLGWLVFVELPVEEAYGPLYAALRRLALVLLAALGFAVLAGMFLARRMVGPIQALRAGAARIGSGDLAQHISIKTGDELEALADQFNDMAGRLQESYAGLEEKVELRTRELREALEELRGLGAISQAVNSTLDLATVLTTIVAHAVQLSRTDGGAIWERDEATEELYLRATHGMSAALLTGLTREQTGLDALIIGDALRKREPVQMPDLREVSSIPIYKREIDAGYRAVLAVPLMGPDRVFGALVIRRRESGLFPQSTIDLLQTFAAQSVIAMQNARLFQEVEEKGRQLEAANLRMSAELDFVGQMQHLILPTPDELAAIDSLDIAAFMEPADEVGGDYYDVLHTDGVVTIGIGDVTGHGLESGILMVMTQAAVRTLQEIRESDPVRFLDTLNRTLYQNMQRMHSDKNLTLALLTYAHGHVSISGQHEEAIIVRHGGAIERIDTIDLGFPLGLEADIAEFIRHTSVALHPGDGVVLYTDGITEAADIHQRLYGIERLCTVISQHWAGTAHDIQAAVIADVQCHIGAQKVFDDITLVVAKQR